MNRFTTQEKTIYPITDSWFKPIYDKIQKAKKDKKFISKGKKYKILMEGMGLKKFKGKFLDPATKKGPVDVASFKDGELENIKSVYDENMTKQALSISISKLKQFFNNEKIENDGAYKHIKNIPTSVAIDILANEWKNRPPVLPNIRKEILWPIEKRGAYFIGVDTSNLSDQLSFNRNPEDLHMTLAYLGDKSPEEIERIKQYLKGIAERNYSFTTNAPFYAWFDKRRYPHVGVEKDKKLKKLQKALSIYNVRPGSFIPHITIGTANDIQLLPDNQNITVPINNITLYKTVDNSSIGQFNPALQQRYEKVERFDLKSPTLIQKILEALKGNLS